MKAKPHSNRGGGPGSRQGKNPAARTEKTVKVRRETNPNPRTEKIVKVRGENPNPRTENPAPRAGGKPVRLRQVMPTDQAPEGAQPGRPVRKLSFAARRRGKPPTHFADLGVEDRKKLVVEAGLPAFRANQLARHYFTNHQADPQAMTDLPASARAVVAEKIMPRLIRQVTSQRADGGTTVKYLWELYDGARVESVLMRYPNRTTLCISSQAGCGMACPFCATGQMGLTRNLSAAEIIEQIRDAARACAEGELAGGPTRLTNIVFMGMGEPLANFPAIRTVLARLTDPTPEGFGMSARNITVSTVGLVPKIDQLAQLGLPVTLAVSLHAPDDELRDELIPINSRWKVGELLDAARNYFRATGRRVSIEYALIKDMNDHPWRAQLLADEINRRGRGWVHVNPIPLNPTPGSIWTASTPRAQREFVETLRKSGITTTIRDTRGSDIDGACGQLATSVKKAEDKHNE